MNTEKLFGIVPVLFKDKFREHNIIRWVRHVMNDVMQLDSQLPVA